jgi:hypothetical protein
MLYQAATGLKARQERDKWQLVRDLTKEEMEDIKKTSNYDFLRNFRRILLRLLLKSSKSRKTGK